MEIFYFFSVKNEKNRNQNYLNFFGIVKFLDILILEQIINFFKT